MRSDLDKGATAVFRRAEDIFGVFGRCGGVEVDCAKGVFRGSASCRCARLLGLAGLRAVGIEMYVGSRISGCCGYGRSWHIAAGHVLRRHFDCPSESLSSPQKFGRRTGAGVTGRLGRSTAEGKSVRIKLSLLSRDGCSVSGDWACLLAF